MTSGLLDTSVIISWDDPEVLDVLPDEAAVSAITMAELAAGPHLASTSAESARRQVRLQQVEASFAPLVFDAAAARSYGQVVAAVTANGRSLRSRIADLLIAATAHANGLALYTRNPDDFAGLDEIIAVIGV